MTNNTAGLCFTFCSLFESEIFLQLVLEKWDHPLASDVDFRQDILEAASSLLEIASDEHCSEFFIEDLPANQMNFVAAVWYVEFCSIQDPVENRQARDNWLTEIRKSLPSCFCPSDLPEP